MLIHLFLLAALLVGPIDAAQSDFEAGRYDDAIKALLAMHQMAPEDAAVNHWLSRSYYEEKHYDLAIAYSEQAVKGASQNAEYPRWLGRAYGAKASEARAIGQRWPRSAEIAAAHSCTAFA